jgi:serine phosphatase RsbU (regulator of sigma subunit)
VSIASSLNLDEVLRTVLVSTLDLLAAATVHIFLYESRSDSFTLTAALDSDTRQSLRLPSPPRQDGLTATVARTGQPMFVPDIQVHPLYLGWSQFKHFRAIGGYPLKQRDEVMGVISVTYARPHQFTGMELAALQLLATQAAVAVGNARLYDLEVKQVEQELAIARRIQQGFLPDHVPQISGWQIAAVCLPARETAGDFYEFVRRRDNCYGLAIGDVSGKSIQAAMLMAAAQSVVASKGSDHRSPARVMAETNRMLYEDVPADSFVAVSYALVSAGGSTLSFSNGGQLAPYYVPAGSDPLQLLEPDGPHWPLGVLEEVAYQELAVPMQPGDLLVFFTDGLVERMDEHRRIFGFERVADVLEGLRGQSAETVLSALLAAADQFAAGLSAHDDVTLLVVQRTL